jgi:hypothetical protein
MKNFTLTSRGTFINLCTDKTSIDTMIQSYFASKNFSVLPFLKETNSFVLIVSDYPVEKGRLFKLLDPYRRYCDRVVLLILDNHNDIHHLPYSDFMGYGISNIVYVSSDEEVITELDKAFSRWLAINKLINSESEKKKSEVNSFIHLPTIDKKLVQKSRYSEKYNFESVENQDNVFALFDYNS